MKLDAIVGTYVEHGPEILVVAVGWWLLERFVSVIMDAFLPVKKEYIGDRDSRMVGLLHGAMSCVLAIISLAEPGSPIVKDRLFGSSYISNVTLTLSSGLVSLSLTLYVSLSLPSLLFSLVLFL